MDMDYITARWNLIKNVSDTQLSILHNIENAVHSYTFSSKYKKNKIIMPVWWQAGIKWLGLNGDFWRKSADVSQRMKMHMFAFKVKQGLVRKNILNCENLLFKDINLMHQCDLEVKNFVPSSSSKQTPNNATKTQPQKMLVA
ncbi:MAG: hypothetical protein HOF38_05220 [Elusimicrobiaceae bacterium]|jgi:hypothetical protein|nr:hypothetical protein [Elusimicrobiaceae bacterium]